jgi:DNA repair protein RadC
MNDSHILAIHRDPTTTNTRPAQAAPVAASAAPTDHRVSTAHDRTTHLVADVLGTSLDRTHQVLRDLGGLAGLAYASESDLRGAALPRSRARLVRAAFELARLSVGERPQLGQRLAGSSDVWVHMRARLSGAPAEEFWAVALDVRHRVVLDQMLARGSLTGVEIHPRDVFRPLIKAGAAAVIFCHNHPSGDPSPSRADIELTARLRDVGELCGIAVLDHVVVAAGGYTILAERNWR